MTTEWFNPCPPVPLWKKVLFMARGEPTVFFFFAELGLILNNNIHNNNSRETFNFQELRVKIVLKNTNILQYLQLKSIMQSCAEQHCNALQCRQGCAQSLMQSVHALLNRQNGNRTHTHKSC